MIYTYFPVGLAFAVALVIGLSMVGISSLLSKSNPNAVKGEPFECGIPSHGTLGEHYSVRFFLTSVLFLLFDVEVVFLFPWASVFKGFLDQGQGLFLLAEMGFFLAILALGLVYVVKKGALEWE